MWKVWSGWVVACGLVLSSSLAMAQDSGPGPITGAGSQSYEVTVLKIGSSQTGTFAFAVEATEPGTGTTSTAFTTGTFTGTVNDVASTGTWYAVDVGNYALWVATATSASGNQTITGIATPEFIAGRIVTQSTASTGRFRFLRALLNTSIFYGTAVTTEEPPTDPMTTVN